MRTTLHMLATLAAVGVLAGGSLSLVSGWAQPLINENETRVKLAAVMEVVPGGRSSTPLAEIVQEAAGLDAYQVMDSLGQALGWAVVGEGTGFADKIRLIVGLSADLTETRGLKVLKDAETPGLGTKIREGSFPEQFADKGSGHPRLDQGGLKVVKSSPKPPSEILSITGATISSKAVVRIINDSAQKLRTTLESRLPGAIPAPEEAVEKKLVGKEGGA